MPKRPRADETSDEEEIESSSTVLDKLLQSAKAETNSGLRGKPRSKTKQRRNTPPKSSTKKQAAARNTLHKVGQVAVVSCGLVRITEQTKRKKAVDLADTHQLADNTFPSHLDIRRLRVRSQAVVNKQDGIEFNTDWTHLEVDRWIRQQLPSFSDHLDQLPARRNPTFDPETSPSYEEFLPKYFLCTKERTRAVLVPGATFFTGNDISDAVEDLQKRHFKYKVLLFCTLDEFELAGTTVSPNIDNESSDEDVKPSRHVEDSPEPEAGPSQPRTRHTASSSRRVLARTTSLDLEIEKAFMASTEFLKHPV